jgi:hypothetical protein
MHARICLPALSLLPPSAGSPYEVRFLQDQRAVADGGDVTSVYYDNPGGWWVVGVGPRVGEVGGWHLWVGQLGLQRTRLNPVLTGGTAASGLLPGCCSSLPAQASPHPLCTLCLSAPLPPAPPQPPWTATTPGCARMTWPASCACAGGGAEGSKSNGQPRRAAGSSPACKFEAQGAARAWAASLGRRRCL